MGKGEFWVQMVLLWHLPSEANWAMLTSQASTPLGQTLKALKMGQMRFVMTLNDMSASEPALSTKQ